MGNNLRGDSVKLGSHAKITVAPYSVRARHNGDRGEGWIVTYTIYESRCKLYLEKFVDELAHVSKVLLKLEDGICFGGGIRIWMERSQTDFSEVKYEYDISFYDMMLLKTNETSNSRGIVKTTVFCYRRGNKGGLVVVESKKKSRNDKYPYTATVAHYYAINSGNVFGQIDMGLSTVVNIRVSNNGLDSTVEGPDRHPSSALFYMFEQVYTSGSWNPLACPHCANTQRQQRRGVYGLSESEEGNSTGNSSQRNAIRSILENKIIMGDKNGNMKGRDFYFAFF